VLGSHTDVNRGSNGSLRANATGLITDIDNPGVAQWFNTAAFTLPPAGQLETWAQHVERDRTDHNDYNDAEDSRSPMGVASTSAPDRPTPEHAAVQRRGYGELTFV
jgi:hypothetical protein